MSHGCMKGYAAPRLHTIFDVGFRSYSLLPRGLNTCWTSLRRQIQPPAFSCIPSTEDKKMKIPKRNNHLLLYYTHCFHYVVARRCNKPVSSLTLFSTFEFLLETRFTSHILRLYRPVLPRKRMKEMPNRVGSISYLSM